MTHSTDMKNSDSLRDRVIAAIRTVFDPEIPVNLYDLGLVYAIRIGDDARIVITMTLTSPNCPVAEAIPQQITEAVKTETGVKNVSVDLIWEPAWTPDRMSEDARLQMEMQGITIPDHSKPKLTNLTVNRRRSRRP